MSPVPVRGPACGFPPVSYGPYPRTGDGRLFSFDAVGASPEGHMLNRLFRYFFPKPLTEAERRWAVLLAVSCERVK